MVLKPKMLDQIPVKETILKKTLSGISISLSSSFHVSLSILFLEINWDHWDLMVVITRANFTLFADL